MQFNIQHYSDGLSKTYGNEFNLDIEEVVEEAIYYNAISQSYTEESLTELLETMTPGSITFGTRWSEIRITKF